MVESNEEGFYLLSKEEHSNVIEGPIRRLKLPKAMLTQLEEIYHDAAQYVWKPFKYFCEGFLRDVHPEREVAIWRMIADAFLLYHKRHGDGREISEEEQGQLVACLIYISTGGGTITPLNEIQMQNDNEKYRLYRCWLDVMRINGPITMPPELTTPDEPALSLIDVLSERLDQIGSDAESEPPWRDWIYEPLPLTPWQVWTMIGLVFHQERLKFVVETLRSVEGVLAKLATSSAAEQRGTWKLGGAEPLIEMDYSIQGRNCCLTNRKTGEIIDVDFHDESAAWIDENSFIRCLKSLKSPLDLESRLITLHPSFDDLRQTINELINIGGLEQLGNRNVVRLNFDSQEMLYWNLSEIEEKWGDKNTRRAMAAAVGDWFLLEELVPDNSQDIVAIRKKAAACKAGRTTE